MNKSMAQLPFLESEVEENLWIIEKLFSSFLSQRQSWSEKFLDSWAEVI